MHSIHSIYFRPRAPFRRTSKKKADRPVPSDPTFVCYVNGSPVRGLSLTQPWAWLMQEGHKIDENRTRKWRVLYRSFLLLHASERMRDGDWNNCRTFMESRGIVNVVLPNQDQLKLGGFVALAFCEFLGDENTYRSNGVTPDKFFTGPYAYRLKCKPIDFIPATGLHGLWFPALTTKQWHAVLPPFPPEDAPPVQSTQPSLDL